MAYPGIVLLLAVVVGVGYAAYSIYNNNNQRNSQHSYNRRSESDYAWSTPVTQPPQNKGQRLIEKKTKRKKSIEEYPDCCSICLEPKQEQDTYTLRCKHSFHGVCILKLLENQSTCPLCRMDIKLKM